MTTSAKTVRPRLVNAALYLLATLSFVLPRATWAGIVTEDITFSGPQEAFNVSIAATGSAQFQGSGTLAGTPLLVNPQNIPLALNPNPTTFASHPSGIAAKVQIDDHTGKVVGISSLMLNLLDNVPTASLKEVGVHTLINGNPVTLPLDATFVFQNPYFARDVAAFTSNPWLGNPTVTGDTFSIGGQFYLPTALTVNLGSANLVQNIYVPLYASGIVTGTISYLPASSPHDENIALDCSFSFTGAVVSPSLSVSVNDAPLITFNGTANASFDISASATMHLQADPVGVIVPEPSGLGLLAMGLSILPLAVRVYRKRLRHGL